MISVQAPGRHVKSRAGVSGVDSGPAADLPVSSFSASPVERYVHTSDLVSCFSFLSVKLANEKLQRKKLACFFFFFFFKDVVLGYSDN